MRGLLCAAAVSFLFPIVAQADGIETYNATSTVVSYSTTQCGPGVIACGETLWTFTGPMDFTVIDFGIIDPSVSGSSTEWLFDGGGIVNISSGDTLHNLSYISQCTVAEIKADDCSLSRLIRLITFFEMAPSLAGESEIESWNVNIGPPTDGQFTFTSLGSTATPEPSTLALLLSGFATIMLTQKMAKKRRRVRPMLRTLRLSGEFFFSLI